MDYKDRMKAEYAELKERYVKLRKILIKYEAGKLDFKPDCPIGLLHRQKSAMDEYLECLEIRAEYEGGRAGMTINILGIPYEIREVDIIDRDTHLVGQISYTEQVIRIEKGLGKEFRRQTVIHEVVHGILEGLGYRDINTDEQKVQGIASALHQLFTPEFFDTCDLVDELKRREGVNAEWVEPYRDKTVSVNGPAVILTVID